MEKVFLGQYEHKLENNNRIIIPAKFRNQLMGDTFVVSTGFDECLEMRDVSTFKVWMDKLSHLGSGAKEARFLRRQIMAFSEEVAFDKLGRIKISNVLASKAQLSNIVVLVGNADKIEIWAQAKWNQYLSATKPLSDYAEKFEDVF